jgi:outer membrane receptor protein involved in Fe transport
VTTVINGFSLGNKPGGPNPFGHSSNFGVNDDVSMVRGAHQFAFSGDYMRSILWTTSNAFSQGTFTIGGATSGSNVADFLIGAVSQIREESPNPINIYQNFFGLYAQDTWKMTPKLTMTYGVRWNPSSRCNSSKAMFIASAWTGSMPV